MQVIITVDKRSNEVCISYSYMYKKFTGFLDELVALVPNNFNLSYIVSADGETQAVDSIAYSIHESEASSDFKLSLFQYFLSDAVSVVDEGDNYKAEIIINF